MRNAAREVNDFETALHLTECIAQHFAVFARDDTRQLVAVCVDQLTEAEHHAGAFERRRTPPFCKRPLCATHCVFYDSPVGEGDAPSDATFARIIDVARSDVWCDRHSIAVDEMRENRDALRGRALAGLWFRGDCCHVSKIPDLVPVELEALAGDPYPVLHKLRRESPVAPGVTPGGRAMWLVTRRDDVLEVLRDTETFSTDHPASPIRDTFGEQMLSVEGETQRRFKSACAAPFNRRAVEANALPIVRARANELIGKIEELPNGNVDLRVSLAGPLALAVVADVIGLPEAMHGSIRAWYDAFAAALATHDRNSVARREGRNSAAAFRYAVSVVIPQISAQSPDSLLGHLASLAAPVRLSGDEVLSNTLIVLFGGIETTEAAILNALWALLTHDDARMAALSDERALDAAIEESLRWEPAVQTCTRYATRPVTLRGVAIGEGDIVQCMIGGANRDPEHFVDPDRFDSKRANASEHLSFGSGRHYCLGAAFARLEARVAIRGLFERFPALMLDHSRDNSPRGHEFRKPPALWVTR